MQAFGACSRLAEYLNESLFGKNLFIYSSFLTFGSPLLVYLIFMFVFRLKNLVNSKKVPFMTFNLNSFEILLDYESIRMHTL